MRVLFWGTPEFAVPSLRALMGEGHTVIGVVTQPDRPAGRGRKLRPSAVKEVALAEGVPILTPERPRGEAFLDSIRVLEPEVSVVAAYGHLLLPEVLEAPELGSVNVHGSLLPALRGAAPVNWAVIRGYERTGITIMRMTAGMDAGPILLQREVPIGVDDTASTLLLRLSEVGAEALVEALALQEAGFLAPVEQDESLATYAPKIGRADARIDWAAGATEVAQLIRGMDRVPGAWTTLANAPVKLFRPQVLERSSGERVGSAGAEAPGTILLADPREGLQVQTGTGALAIGEVQPAGKRLMEALEWLRGGTIQAGDRFH